MTAFDTERFILEVQSRKAVWDLSSDDYSNRDLKKKQWEELVELFGGEELPEEEKKNLGLSLQRKWKNMRSCFAREVRRLKNTKSGSAASRKTPYVYYKQLLFLKNTVGNLNTENSIAEEEHSTNDQEPLGPYSRENIIGRKKRNTSDDGTRELLDTLNKCIDARKHSVEVSERDEDKMFLLSLLSSFKKIPEHKKAAAKIQLITIIDSFATSTPIYPNTMWSSTSTPGFLPSQQSRLNYNYTLPPSASSHERPESQLSASSVSQDSEILDLF